MTMVGRESRRRSLHASNNKSLVVAVLLVLLLLLSCVGTTVVNGFPITPQPNSLVQTRAQNGPTPSSFTRSFSTRLYERFSVVDLNQYNVPLEEALQQWSVVAVAKTAQSDGGIFLRTQDDRQYYTDTIEYSFPRSANAGMGILLQEIAGGREDGLGITLVTGLVEGGSAEGCGILEGDSIVGVGIRKTGMESMDNTSSGGMTESFGSVNGKESNGQNSNGRTMASTAGLSEVEDIVSVSTECLGYDATVDAILSLPPSSSTVDQTEEFVVTVKRIRRKPKVKVNLQFPPDDERKDTTIELFSGELLRQAMLTRGVTLNDPTAKRFDTKNSGNCGAGGLCTTCVVSVLKGGNLLNPMRNQEQQMLADQPRWRLACKSVVGFGMQEGEMTLRVHPNQWEYE